MHPLKPPKALRLQRFAGLFALITVKLGATDGVIESDVEETIRNMERISKEGMTSMDDLLLNIMLNKQGDC